ncbi:MAG: hypothetical protein JO136_16875 [Hyphomicrobiales bacterium]|nr:hypothetical protein [Hyphomicrobiales bacterium]MBV9909158.1 hypothetical protein [Hyphomicrobiales bacterium]
MIVVEPVAAEVPFTEDVELIVVAVTSKIAPPTGAKEKPSVVAVAVPVSVGGNDELAVSLTEPDRPKAGRLKEPEFVTSYGGGADAEAGDTGPTEMGIPATVNAMLRPVDELEIVVTSELAGDTPSAGTMPADRANALIVVIVDPLSAMTQLPCVVSSFHRRLQVIRIATLEFYPNSERLNSPLLRSIAAHSGVS